MTKRFGATHVAKQDKSSRIELNSCKNKKGGKNMTKN